MTAKTFILPVTAAPPTPGVPSWWTDDVFFRVGEWLPFAAGDAVGNSETIKTLTGTMTVSDARQKGLSFYRAVPLNSSNWNTYYGGAIDQTTKRGLYAGGGHDVMENTIMLLDMGIEAPRWYLANPNTYTGTATYPAFNNSGQYLTDIDLGNHRPAAGHTNNDIQVHNGYYWIPGQWALRCTGVIPGTTTNLSHSTAIFRSAVNQVPGATFTWEKLGNGIGVDNDMQKFGEDGPCCVVSSRNEIWRGAGGVAAGEPGLYRVSTGDGSVVGRYTRGGVVTLVGQRGTTAVGTTMFNSYGAACEIYPDATRTKTFLVGVFLGSGQRPNGWFLWDADEPHVYYDITAKIQNNSPLPIGTAWYQHSAYSSLHHLHGTQKIYLSYADWYSVTGGYVANRFLRLTIPQGTTAAELAAGNWALDEIAPGGPQPPLQNSIMVCGKFYLIQDMGDALHRPAIVQFVMPWGTFGGGTTLPHVWICKMPFGGL